MSSSSETATDPPMGPLVEPHDPRQVSLCEALDRMLNKGVVVAGEIVISVADIDLIYLNIQALLSSVETAYRQRPRPAEATSTSIDQS
jgi:hypothetical protein